MMFQNQEVWLLIPAKKNNLGCPGKNRMMLAGRPIIDYTLRQARECSYIDRIFLVTDDPELAAATPGVPNVDIPHEYFAQTPSTRSVVQAVHTLLSSGKMERPGIIVEAYASTPIRPENSFVRLIEGFQDADVDCTCVIEPVRDHPNWHVTVDARGMIKQPDVTIPRQEFYDVWKMSAAGWAARWSFFESGRDTYSGAVLGIRAGSEVVDIDDEKDKVVAEWFINKRLLRS